MSVESKESMEITTTGNWKTKALIIGGVAGALVGVAAAYLLIQRTGDEKPPEVSLGEGVKIGVWVMGLMRNIANL